jgi:hypothetical protein
MKAALFAIPLLAVGVAHSQSYTFTQFDVPGVVSNQCHRAGRNPLE